MPSSDNKKSLRKKWKLGTREILWIIPCLLIAFFMLYFLFKEMKDEEEFKKHKDVEHNYPL